MKKLLIIIPIFFFLVSCCPSAQSDIFEISRNINKTFEREIIVPLELTTVHQNNDYVTYWFPDEFNVQCAFYSDTESGIIKKYCVSSNINNKKSEYFIDSFTRAIYKNNKDIKVSKYEMNDYVIWIYTDTRYPVNDNNLTLKSEIDENNINYPLFEKESNIEN